MAERCGYAPHDSLNLNRLASAEGAEGNPPEVPTPSVGETSHGRYQQ
jgi:hypothetical protein